MGAACGETGSRLARGAVVSRAPSSATREAYREDAAFILATLEGRLSLAPFEGWAGFSRYAAACAADARLDGCADLADVMQAASNRAARNAARGVQS